MHGVQATAKAAPATIGPPEPARLISAIAFARMTTAFSFVKRHYAVIMAAGGVVLIIMGILVFTGELTRLNIELQQWLDEQGINFFNEV